MNATAVGFLLLLAASISVGSAATWQVIFDPAEITIHMSESDEVLMRLQGLSPDALQSTGAYLEVRTDNEKLARVDLRIDPHEISDGSWNGSVRIEALFLGLPMIFVEIINADGTVRERSDERLPVTIIREVRTIDHIFTGSVATLVSILYINFGAALSLPRLRSIAVRPIGPAIGFFGQFLVMPLLSFGLGMLLFPNNVEMQLGMFFTGASPAGGASNIWTVLLEGNLDLSIAMTTFSNIASFGMMPLWIFTLGKVIFDRGDIPIPYESLMTYVIALVVPLAIGLLIQRFLPRVARILVRVLKPVSTLLLIFIVVFAIVTNLYLFELFSWEIVVGGLCLPWLSYILGYSAAWIFRQPSPDCMAIALETGIQNTGISIFLLRFTLPQPAADLTTVMPVSVAIMTPLPLICCYFYLLGRRIVRNRRNKGKAAEITESGGEIGTDNLALEPANNEDDKKVIDDDLNRRQKQIDGIKAID